MDHLFRSSVVRHNPHHQDDSPIVHILLQPTPLEENAKEFAADDGYRYDVRIMLPEPKNAEIKGVDAVIKVRNRILTSVLLRYFAALLFIEMLR